MEKNALFLTKLFQQDTQSIFFSIGTGLRYVC